jgi:hypothetical protein
VTQNRLSGCSVEVLQKKSLDAFYSLLDDDKKESFCRHFGLNSDFSMYMM